MDSCRDCTKRSCLGFLTRIQLTLRFLFWVLQWVIQRQPQIRVLYPRASPSHSPPHPLTGLNSEARWAAGGCWRSVSQLVSSGKLNYGPISLWLLFSVRSFLFSVLFHRRVGRVINLPSSQQTLSLSTNMREDVTRRMLVLKWVWLVGENKILSCSGSSHCSDYVTV